MRTWTRETSQDENGIRSLIFSGGAVIQSTPEGARNTGCSVAKRKMVIMRYLVVYAFDHLLVLGVTSATRMNVRRWLGSRRT